MKLSRRCRIMCAITILIMLAGACTRDTTQQSRIGSQDGADTWPLPYEKVSQESIEWLKSRGWWPLPIGNQPGLLPSPIWEGLDLDRKRGLETETQYFPSGPELNEAGIAGRIAGGLSGNFPFTSLVATRAPIKAVLVTLPSLRHALMVPSGSQIDSFDDLKRLDHKPVIGLVTGSSGEFFFQSILKSEGLRSSDFILRNLTPPDITLMPEGLDAAVLWDPWVAIMTEERNNARVIETQYRYNLYNAFVWLSTDLIENAPDVAQAFVDMFVESVLFSREDPGGAKAFYKEDPASANFSPATLSVLVDKVMNTYKPTWMGVYPEFWATENAEVARFLYDSERIDDLVTREDYENTMEPEFAFDTFRRLGWEIPQNPPFIPEDWTGRPGEPPYPPYHTLDEQPQEWPEPGDLVDDESKPSG